MSTELELKFTLPNSALAQLIAMLPQLGQLQKQEEAKLLNAYFDTAERWFRLHDMGLRSRFKRGRYEQTIKLAGTSHGALQMRPEYNLPCNGVVPDLQQFPPQIWPQGTDIAALQQQLTELFRTDFHRRSWQLQTNDSLIELVYDEGKVIAAGREEAIAELELELLSGPADALFHVARQLIAALPLQTGFYSKAARGYMLGAGKVPDLPANDSEHLADMLRALQQAEACYLRQPSPDALVCAQQKMQQLAAQLPAASQAQHSAGKLAAELTKQPVFADSRYNLLLLDITEQLFTAAHGDHNV